MPFINVKLIEGVFDSAQKREINEKLTDTVVSIEGENMRPGDVVRHRGSAQRRLGHEGHHAHHCRCQEPRRWAAGGGVDMIKDER